MRFSYVARTMNGQEQRGNVDADSLEDAREHIRKRKLLIEEIHESKSAPVSHSSSALWTEIPDEPGVARQAAGPAAEAHPYVPLIETARLFAGWLLAWYGLIYLLGSMQSLQQLPLEIPFVESLYLSPLILRLTFGTFLFLFFTTVHRAWGKGIGKGILLTLAGALVFLFFHANA